ncbi:MAG TPA: toll/interleukin-1 receptor domain-containing protein, partial [Ideonella sp.]|nr:toll/interleukin-1 receptor domain-containing protein [Ideonella sp.]
MSSGIFISYRRADSRHAAGRLADELGAAFGEANIFRDIEGIEIGVNFELALERALGACVVMLVLIGPQWLDARDEAGKRRLDQPKDWTRQEIATALKRGIPVVPVLLEGTPLPRADQLPEDLSELVNRQQYELSDGHWRGDVQTLVDKLARVKGLQRVGSVPTPSPGPSPAPTPTKRKPHWGWWVAAGAGVLMAAVWSDFESGSGSGDGGVAFQPPVQASLMPAAEPAAPAAKRTEPLVAASISNESAAATPRLAGLWRTSSGETYHFQQEGMLVRFTAEANGQNIGNGSGELEGNLLRLQMSMQLNGTFLGNLVCNMQAAPDMRSFTGLCVGPRGQFPAQFF